MTAASCQAGKRCCRRDRTMHGQGTRETVQMCARSQYCRHLAGLQAPGRDNCHRCFVDACRLSMNPRCHRCRLSLTCASVATAVDGDTDCLYDSTPQRMATEPVLHLCGRRCGLRYSARRCVSGQACHHPTMPLDKMTTTWVRVACGWTCVCASTVI